MTGPSGHTRFPVPGTGNSSYSPVAMGRLSHDAQRCTTDPRKTPTTTRAQYHSPAMATDDRPTARLRRASSTDVVPGDGHCCSPPTATDTSATVRKRPRSNRIVETHYPEFARPTSGARRIAPRVRQTGVRRLSEARSRRARAPPRRDRPRHGAFRIRAATSTPAPPGPCPGGHRHGGAPPCRDATPPSPFPVSRRPQSFETLLHGYLV